MNIFNPRLAAFYVVLFVTIAMLSNRLTAKPQPKFASVKKTAVSEKAR